MWQLDITLPDGEVITPIPELLSRPYLDTVESLETLQKLLSKRERLPFQRVESTVPVSFRDSQGKLWQVSPHRVATGQERELV